MGQVQANWKRHSSNPVAAGFARRKDRILTQGGVSGHRMTKPNREPLNTHDGSSYGCYWDRFFLFSPLQLSIPGQLPDQKQFSIPADKSERSQRQKNLSKGK